MAILVPFSFPLSMLQSLLSFYKHLIGRALAYGLHLEIDPSRSLPVFYFPACKMAMRNRVSKPQISKGSSAVTLLPDPFYTNWPVHFNARCNPIYMATYSSHASKHRDPTSPDNPPAPIFFTSSFLFTLPAMCTYPGLSNNSIYATNSTIPIMQASWRFSNRVENKDHLFYMYTSF